MKTKQNPTAHGSGAGKTYGGYPGLVPARRGRPPKHKKRLLRHAASVSEPEAAAPEPPAPNRGLIQAEYMCAACHQSPLCNSKGLYEALLFCKDCTYRVHPSCLNYSEELSFRVQKEAWQCMDCKTCRICLDAGDPNEMLFCDGCDKGHHMKCTNPPIEEKPSGKWVCEECIVDGVSAEDLERKEVERQQQREREQQEALAQAPPPAPLVSPTIKQEAGSTLPPTPAASPSADDAGRQLRFEPLDPGAGRKLLSKEPRFITNTCYPDATNWTIADVAQFFVSAGFNEQAEVFKEQEIDGKSLLLMKRSDVLTGLSIKLGPALKIHRHVQRLQLAGMNNFL